ncbi:hypothetical protein C8A03DRAFT_33029 [Achaetomium macrosporum]|uniref:Uncharacterized protein n=1 Tax=Achaetomium macrosporum TaxID=79813 RepID=A0AAN7CBD1_9PEZI|nr:hypothetical protein C8A03DRAFT_33029 [Achaetomium macrosporum]
MRLGSYEIHRLNCPIANWNNLPVDLRIFPNFNIVPLGILSLAGEAIRPRMRWRLRSRWMPTAPSTPASGMPNIRDVAFETIGMHERTICTLLYEVGITQLDNIRLDGYLSAELVVTVQVSNRDWANATSRTRPIAFPLAWSGWPQSSKARQT